MKVTSVLVVAVAMGMSAFTQATTLSFKGECRLFDSAIGFRQKLSDFGLEISTPHDFLDKKMKFTVLDHEGKSKDFVAVAILERHNGVPVDTAALQISEPGSDSQQDSWVGNVKSGTRLTQYYYLPPKKVGYSRIECGGEVN
jgi:hypothetical protein